MAAKIATTFARFIDSISHGINVAGGICIILLNLLLCTEVTLRYVFNTSTLISDELSLYFMVAIVYFTLAYTLQKHRHIEIDILTSRLKQSLRHQLNRLIAIINIPLFLLLTWRAWDLVLDSYRVKETYPGILYTPGYLPKLLVALGVTVLLLQAIVELGRRFYLIRDQEEKATGSSLI